MANNGQPVTIMPIEAIPANSKSRRWGNVLHASRRFRVFPSPPFEYSAGNPNYGCCFTERNGDSAVTVLDVYRLIMILMLLGV